MTQHIFTIHDSKAEAYLAPYMASTYGIAERMFTELVNTNGHQFNKYPADYTLYCVGKFDTQNAMLKPTDLTVIITGIQAKNE